jgi:hypothetical protein
MSSGHYVTSVRWLHQDGNHRLLIGFAGFFSHLLIGAVLFALVLLPVVALNSAVIYFQRLGVEAVIVNAIMAIGYLIMAADILLFLIYVVMSGLRAFQK